MRLASTVGGEPAPSASPFASLVEAGTLRLGALVGSIIASVMLALLSVDDLVR